MRQFAPAPQETVWLTIGNCLVPMGNKILFCCQELPEFVLGVEICEDLWAVLPPTRDLVCYCYGQSVCQQRTNW